jgi:hypothetical protein
MNQATAHRSSTRPVRRSGGGGGGFWLLIAVVILSVGAIYIFAPELPRQWFGTAKPPADKGPEPTAPQVVKTDLVDKNQQVDQDLGKPKVAVDNTPKTKIDTKPTPEKPKIFSDEVRGQEILALAKQAYSAMQWSKASMEARKISSMSVSPAISVHAQDVVNGVAAIEKLFAELKDDKDELIRYYDTHPSLVLLNNGGGQPTMAVPIASIDNPAPIEKNALEYIAAQRKTGKVAFLIKSKKDYIPSSLPADIIGEVTLPDYAAIIKEKRSEFETRLNRLRNSTLSNDPLAWYDAGKFAYRNRIDEFVTEMLNQAVVLDANLVSRVREDKAAGYYANIVSHMKNGNKKQADAFMAIIVRRFSDTEQGKQARLYYDGKTGEVLQAAKLEQDRRSAEEKARREAQLARAKKLDDKEAIAKIEKQPAQEDNEKALLASAATGDEGKADTLFAKGRDLYNKALDAGNTPARDELYEQAYKELHEARAIYSALVTKSPNNEALGVKLLECNKLHYGSIKQRRFH